MDNLDDFMKKKMLGTGPNDGGSYEFKEEYWQQAEALIEADERRKRRRFFWWLSAGFLVLAITLGWCWWHAAPDATELTSAERRNDASPTGNQPSTASPAHSLDPQASGQTTASPSGTQPTGSPSSTSSENSIAGSTASGTSGSPLNERQASTHSSDKQPVNSNNSTSTARPARQNGTAALATKTQGPAGQSPASTDKKNPGHPAPTENRDAGGKPQDATGLSDATAPKPVTDKADGVASPNREDDRSGKDPLPQNSVAVSTPNDPPAAAPEQQVKLPDLSFLPTFLRLVEHAVPGLPKSQLPPPVAQLENPEQPPSGGRFNLALHVFGSGYLPSTLAQSYGYGAGMTIEYPMSPSWAIQFAPQWRARAIPYFLTGDLDDVSQLRYSFGFESDEYTVRGMASHWLEFPLGVRWRKGAWRLETGLAAGLLLGVQGRMTHTHEASLVARSTKHRTVQLTTEPFYNQYFPIYAGGAYSLNKRLAIDLRLHYLGGDFRRQTSDYTPPRQTLWLDAGLRWSLF